MPSLTIPETPHYVHAPPTQADLDYADLPVIDFSKISTSEERAEQAIRVRDAMQEHGFLYIVNHGYTPAQTSRMFDIADAAFAQVPQEEKEKYAGTMKATGSYQGYKLRNYWHIDKGVHDQLEHYNINRDVNRRGHPEALRPFLPEIEAFAKHNHFNVLHPLLRLLSLGLELPEETLVNLHRYDTVGETYTRFMKYYPRSEEEETKTNKVWLKGHTGMFSVPFPSIQPVAALQILSRDGTWKWIRHIENALVINAGDGLEFLSGGYYRATIHRVVQPPADQHGYTRVGVFGFCMTDDDVKLAPLVDSPLLQRVGIKRRFNDEDAPTMETWRKGRTSAYGKSELKTGSDKNTEEEVIAGVVVKHYN